MDGTGLNLSSLRDKISTKMGKPSEKKSSKTKTMKTEAKDKKPKHEKKEKKSTKKTHDEDDEEDALKREALALGATEADIALVDGVEEGEESEQEFGAETGTDTKLSSEVADFMKGLGLGDGSIPEIEEDIPELVEEIEEDEDEEDVKEKEKEEQEDEEEEEEEQDEEEEEDDDEEQEEQEQEEEEEEEDVHDESSSEVEDTLNQDKIDNVASVVSDKLKIPAITQWYEIETEAVHEPEHLDRFAKERLLERGKQLIEEENQTYLTEFASNSQQSKVLTDFLKNGTMNDKISALTLLIREAPLHNLKAFDTLVGYCEKKSRAAALQAIKAFCDLLEHDLLPDRKLVAFDKQLLRKDLSSRRLAIYYFEDHLKKAYFKLITIFEQLGHDPLEYVRSNVIRHVFSLLSSKPEQEVNLLRLGVNKLGDNDNKVSSKASHLVLKLEQTHPAMKKIVTDAIIDVVFQANVDYQTQYYAVVTLNQTILTRNEPDLANSLVKTYFALFEKLLVDIDSNSESSTNKESRDVNTLGKSELGRKNNRKNFKKGKKGGKSVKQQQKSEQELVEEKHAKLFSALLTGLNRSFPFAELPSEVYQKHLDTLFKITHSTNFNTSVQALVLVNHIITQQGLNSDRYYKTLYESLLDPRLSLSSKQGIYLNLLFKSLKNDPDVDRVLAFVKRIVQICTHWLNIGAIAGMIFLLMELSKVCPQVSDLMIDVNSRPEPEVEDEPKAEVPLKSEVSAPKSEAQGEYDPRKRDPKYANAQTSSLWELSQFTNHYHPTVATYATSFMSNEPQPKPDLGLFSLAHFLDRFVYKNAKQKPVTKGSSIMQPLGGAHTGSLLVRATNVMDTNVPANTVDWLNKKVEDLKPDEKFFHQYFTSKLSKSKVKADGEEDERDEDAPDMGDDEIWEALVKSKPEVDGDDVDEGFSDFDDDDFSDMSDGESDEEVQKESEGEEASEAEDQVQAQSEDDEQVFGIDEDDELSDSEIKFLPLDGPESDSEQEEEEENATTSRKRSKSGAGEKDNKRKKLSDMPVFASADDYAQYLDSEDDEY